MPVVPRPPLLIDSRTGSADLLPLIKRLGIRAALADLRYTDSRRSGPDFQWTGHGPVGPATVIVERKKVSEILGCLRGDTRFMNVQIPGMMRTSPFRWLIVEGGVSPGPNGELRVYGQDGGFGAHRYMYRELAAFLLTVELQAGVRIAYTSGLLGTAIWLHAAYCWWQKPWHAHGSLHTVAETAAVRAEDLSLAIEPSLVRKLAAQLPGVAWHRSKAVDQRFPTVMAMVQATRAEWQMVPGIGPGIARSVWRAIRGLK